MQLSAKEATNMSKKIFPIEECLEYDEFTDRVELLRDLELWIKNIRYKRSGSTSIISPRRLGKTVLLERLVNTVFFKPEYQVAPIYFSLKREKKTLRAFIMQYAETFFRQYFAYCLQDPALYKTGSISMKNLLEIETNHDDVKNAQKQLDQFLTYFETNHYDSDINHWANVICLPELIASDSNTYAAIIIDEFQEMNLIAYDISNNIFHELKSKHQLTDEVASDLIPSYQRLSQSRVAPMLVSGSAVTMIFKTVMGGPLGGRFGFIYVKPLSIPDGVTLLLHLIHIYRPNLSIQPEMAFYASSQVGGHPYYLYCLVHSKFEQKFDSKEEIDALIEYEATEGNIFGFWQTHFQSNRHYINEDNDQELGKKIIYYFIRYNNQPVGIEEIAEKLNVSKKSVEEKIEKLYLADLVWRTKGRFYAFNDICLMRYIKFVYEQDLKDIDKIDLSLQSKYNILKGRFLENVVQVTMMKFNYEEIQGEWLGKSGKIKLPLFDVVDTRQVKASTTKSYQIDIFARRQKTTWLCECKYTKNKMGMNQVKKLERAADAAMREASEIGATPPEIQMWLISTGGFTDNVLKFVKKRNDIYCSDHDDINAIFRFYGGNYDIPVF
jgi:predicted transcriptional regulator